MTKQEVWDAVVDICAETLRLPKDKFTPETRLQKDLAVDSLYVVQLVIEFEEKFDIGLSDDDSRSLETMQDIVDLVYKKISSDDQTVSSTQRLPTKDEESAESA